MHFHSLGLRVVQLSSSFPSHSMHNIGATTEAPTVLSHWNRANISPAYRTPFATLSHFTQTCAHCIFLVVNCQESLLCSLGNSCGANGDAIKATRLVSKVLSSGRSSHPSSIAGSQQLRDRDWACTIAQSFWVRVPLSYLHIHPHTFLLVRVSLSVGNEGRGNGDISQLNHHLAGIVQNDLESLGTRPVVPSTSRVLAQSPLSPTGLLLGETQLINQAAFSSPPFRKLQESLHPPCSQHTRQHASW